MFVFNFSKAKIATIIKKNKKAPTLVIFSLAVISIGFIQANLQHLKPAYVAMFRKIGGLQPTSDFYYVNIEIELPNHILGDLQEPSIRSLTCPSEIDDYTKDLSADFVLLTSYEHTHIHKYIHCNADGCYHPW